MNRRHVVFAAMGTLMLLSPSVAVRADTLTPDVKVFKSPTCGCCTAWVEHLRAAGFTVAARDVEQDALWAMKAQSGITPELSSCHTARVDRHVIEGHVPAQDIRRLLTEKPDGLGLSVPGMPIGSPGMEMGDEREPYVTLLVMPDGSSTVFAHHA